MSKKQDRERFARAQAQQLSRLAMQLQRAKPEAIDALLHQADQCLNRYKMAKRLRDEPPSHIIDDTVAADLEAPMNSLAEVIREVVEPFGFALLVFGRDDSTGGRMNYVSNSNRDDICVAMREFIAAHESRLLDGPVTKQ